MSIMSKEEYVYPVIRKAIKKAAEGNYEGLTFEKLLGLAEQFEFDYDMEKQYRPKVLKRPEPETKLKVLTEQMIEELNNFSDEEMICELQKVGIELEPINKDSK